MTARTSSPFAGLGGASGAAEGLETLLARRLQERQQQEQERSARVHEAQIAEQNAQAEHFRQMQLQEQQHTHQEESLNREEGRKIQRVNISLARPMGSELTPEEFGYDTKELGIPASYYDQGQDPGTSTTSTGGSETDSGSPVVSAGRNVIRFRGKEADQLKRDQETERTRIANQTNETNLYRDKQDNLTRVTLAQIAAASKPAHSGTPRITSVNIDGRDVSMALYPDGTTQVLGDSQLPAGMKAKNADINSIVDQIDLIGIQGDKNAWSGVGPVVGGMQGKLKEWTGAGSDDNDMLRVALNSLKADIGHEKYGSAFTATERGMLSSFAPGSNMTPPAIKNRLAVMRRIISTRSKELKSGMTPETATSVATMISGTSPDTGGPQRTGAMAGVTVPAGSGIVEMIAPDGGLLHVPASDVGKYEGLGAKKK